MFFKNGTIEKVTVLVEFSKGDTRAIQATTAPRGGYLTISPKTELNNDLLQEVASYGMEVNASKFFN